MSDDEDSNIIEEISALRNALGSNPAPANRSKCSPSPSKTSSDTETTSQNIAPESVWLKVETKHEKQENQDPNFVSFPDYNEQEEEDDDETTETLQIPDRSQVAKSTSLEELLEFNKKLIECALEAKAKMQQLLDECISKQKYIEGEIASQSNLSSSKNNSFTAAMPYFKDKDFYGAPRNVDTETKIRNGELRLVELQRACKWTHKDKTQLLDAVVEELVGNYRGSGSITPNMLLNKKKQLSTIGKQAIKSWGAKQFDWLKISNHDFENKHTAIECQVMWNVFLHPDINKQKWSSKEDKNLRKIAKRHKFQNWDLIALHLNTNRSGYQCFVRYNTNNWKNLMKGQPWSPVDDSCLVYLVNELKIGDYIPWGYIAGCMKNWTKQQIYFRWMYSLAPNLKKGRFSKEEDEKIRYGVLQYGLNFHKISSLLLPNRTHIQLKDHFQTLELKSKEKKLWTLEDDKAIMTLHQKYGSDWSKIVKEIPNTTRTQARHRYMAIKKCLDRGLTLETMNRKNGDKNIQKEQSQEKRVTLPSEQSCIIPAASLVPFQSGSSEELQVNEQLVNYFKSYNMMLKEQSKKEHFASEKFQDNVQKLYKILQNLNADLRVPENIYNLGLSADNRNLLEGLKQYEEELANTAEGKFEEYHMRMFGPVQYLNGKERFKIPVPYGCKPSQQPDRTYRSLDYNLNTETLNQIQLNMNFESNAVVEDNIGEDAGDQFEKLKKIYCSDEEEASGFQGKQKANTIRCKKFAFFKFSDNDYQEQILPDMLIEEQEEAYQETRKCIYDWKLGRLVNKVEKSEAAMPEGPPANYVEPNKSTLQSYQQILTLTESSPSQTHVPIRNCQLSQKGTEALLLFKRRFRQLYQMPVGMSKILPPYVEESDQRKMKNKNVRKRKYHMLAKDNE